MKNQTTLGFGLSFIVAAVAHTVGLQDIRPFSF